MRHWLRTTAPCVSVPVPISDTAQPLTRSKFPPCVIAATSARPTRLNSEFDRTSTGRFPRISLPAAGSGVTSRISPCLTWRPRPRDVMAPRSRPPGHAPKPRDQKALRPSNRTVHSIAPPRNPSGLAFPDTMFAQKCRRKGQPRGVPQPLEYKLHFHISAMSCNAVPAYTKPNPPPNIVLRHRKIRARAGLAAAAPRERKNIVGRKGAQAARQRRVVAARAQAHRQRAECARRQGRARARVRTVSVGSPASGQWAVPRSRTREQLRYSATPPERRPL